MILRPRSSFCPFRGRGEGGGGGGGGAGKRSCDHVVSYTSQVEMAVSRYLYF